MQENELTETQTQAMSDPLSVRLPVYEGPLDLLLDLIKKNEINIYDIPISEITRQYLEYLERMKQLNLDIAGEFLVMAATLLYIKSKMLLPEDSAEDEDEGEDPRAELVRKLLEYQAFKEAARELGLMETERSKMFTRQISDYYFNDMDLEVSESDPLGANLSDLLVAFHKVLKSISRNNLHEVFEQIITIEEKIEHIRKLIEERRQLLFSELILPGTSRNELIVTFLAVLEITRQKWVHVLQEKTFGEIQIVKNGREPS